MLNALQAGLPITRIGSWSLSNARARAFLGSIEVPGLGVMRINGGEIKRDSWLEDATMPHEACNSRRRVYLRYYSSEGLSAVALVLAPMASKLLYQE